MKKLKELLEKLKKYLNKLLKKESILLLEDSNNQEKLIDETVEIEEIQEEKKEFFELYENVKKGKISLESLMINDLIKVMIMMNQEKDILDNKVCDELNVIEQMDKKIFELQEENKRYTTDTHTA